MDPRFKHAAAHLAGTARAHEDAEHAMRAEHQRIGDSGQIYAEKTIEHGHTITRYHGDIAATFAPFTVGAVWRGRILQPRRGGGR